MTCRLPVSSDLQWKNSVNRALIVLDVVSEWHLRDVDSDCISLKTDLEHCKTDRQIAEESSEICSRVFMHITAVKSHECQLSNVTIVMHLRSYSSGGTTKFLTWTWTWKHSFSSLAELETDGNYAECILKLYILTMHFNTSHYFNTVCQNLCGLSFSRAAKSSA